MRTGRFVSVLFLLPIALAGCSGNGEEKPTTRETAAEKPKPYTGPMAKEAWSALNGGHSRIEMKQVERHGDRSVLRFYLTNPGKEPDHYSFGTSIAGSAFGNLHFMLVDPVGQKAYTPLYDDNGNGKAVGSGLFVTSAHPGARYETILAFPPLPESLDRMTVITPTTAGEFTGVPVVDGQGPVKPTAPAPGLTDEPAPGSRVAWPVRGLDSPAKGGVHNLYGRLGTAYRYQAEGKGETEPVAKENGPDDEKARQRNRRVEISYQIKQRTTETSTTTSREEQERRGGTAGPPAPFRPDGRTVAGRSATFGAGKGDKRRIDVKPFYRDGAYLVAVFDIVNLGPDGGPGPTENYSSSGGGTFGDFTVTDPTTRTVYRGVRMGEDGGDYIDPGWSAFRTEPGTGNRGFFYVPAPPQTVKSVTFNAGPFGQIPDVPVH